MAIAALSWGSNGTLSMLGKQPIFTIRADLEAITSLGRTPYGERRVIGILGGTVRGAKLSGRILPGGADWQIIRSDGAADIKARYTIETDAGALVMVTSEGLRHGPPEVIARLARGDNVDPALYYFRTVMRFETSDPAVDWLNRILALARGQREARAVRLDVYEVE
ncbi:MAG TPA: DUF3237 domain-containing protein [Pseudolabrys sp.]|nr:DUF3237 domain-containing protein [Pseudolabrys sp.]